MHGERVFGRFEFDERSGPVRAEMRHRFQVDGVRRVILDPGAEPAEERADLHTILEVLPVQIEILLLCVTQTPQSKVS